MSPADSTDEPGGAEPDGAEPNGAEPNGPEPHAFGVPARELVDALRGAGMADADVIAVVGRAIARSAGLAAAAASPPFVFHTPIAETAPDCALTFQRQFVHPPFIDGVTVVQAGATPEEIGLNQRFHTIETDLDHIAGDLHTASNCIAELRRELFGMAQELQAKITEIDTQLDGKTKDKEKDTKEKEKDHEGKLTTSENLAQLPPGSELRTPSGQAAGEPAADEGEERTFIRLEDRPEVGRAALAGPGDAPVAAVPDAPAAEGGGTGGDS